MGHSTIALLVFLFPLAFSPGPGNMFFAANGARFGFRATLAANAGYHAATWLVTAAIGFGSLTALDRFPGIFTVLQLLGALYVLWLAWTFVRAGLLSDSDDAAAAGFGDGAVLMVVNPKAYVIIALMFTQFLDGDDGAWMAEVLVITTLFTLNNCVAFTAWTIAGDALGRLFRSPQSARALNIGFAVLLAGVAVWMLVA